MGRGLTSDGASRRSGRRVAEIRAGPLTTQYGFDERRKRRADALSNKRLLLAWVIRRAGGPLAFGSRPLSTARPRSRIARR